MSSSSPTEWTSDKSVAFYGRPQQLARIARQARARNFTPLFYAQACSNMVRADRGLLALKIIG
jgi:hypothetical protein